MKFKATTPPAARFAYEGLDRVIHERARLGLLTSLLSHPDGLNFVELKGLCDLSDGNLARHLQVLEDDAMIKVSKRDGETRTETLIRITPTGRKRYLDYLNTLEQVVKDAAAAQKPERSHSRNLAPAKA